MAQQFIKATVELQDIQNALRDIFELGMDPSDACVLHQITARVHRGDVDFFVYSNEKKQYLDLRTHPKSFTFPPETAAIANIFDAFVLENIGAIVAPPIPDPLRVLVGREIEIPDLSAYVQEEPEK